MYFDKPDIRLRLCMCEHFGDRENGLEKRELSGHFAMQSNKKKRKKNSCYVIEP